jgi:hypothetical protein
VLRGTPLNLSRLAGVRHDLCSWMAVASLDALHGLNPATGVCRGVAMHPRLLSGAALRQAWTAALAIIGVLLLAFR